MSNEGKQHRHMTSSWQLEPCLVPHEAGKSLGRWAVAQSLRNRGTLRYAVHAPSFKMQTPLPAIHRTMFMEGHAVPCGTVLTPNAIHATEAPISYSFRFFSFFSFSWRPAAGSAPTLANAPTAVCRPLQETWLPAPACPAHDAATSGLHASLFVQWQRLNDNLGHALRMHACVLRLSLIGHPCHCML